MKSETPNASAPAPGEVGRAAAAVDGEETPRPGGCQN